MYSLGLVAILIAGLGVEVAAQAPQKQTATPTPTVRVAIGEAEAELAAAQTDDAKYVGGLIKTLIAARIATIQQTIAMLKQRQAAADLNISLKYTVDGHLFVPPADGAAQAAAVDSEIQSTKAKIVQQEAEAAKYSGGLVLSMTLAGVATSENTLAMLEQKRDALRFGLPQFIGFASSTPTAAPASSSQAAPSAASKADSQFDIVSVDSKVTETNDVWWRYAWKLTIRNKASQAAVYTATIEFQDKDGFVIEQDIARDLGVAAGSDHDFTGFALVRLPGATNVARTNAKVSRVR
jgi:hypothetical protein